jgi:hypothetical protein
VTSIDNSLLKHYGKHFDNIYYHYDYVHKCYRWAHDLVTLHYSDDQTDYPVQFQLWEPPDWEAVATFLKEQNTSPSTKRNGQPARKSLKNGGTTFGPDTKIVGKNAPKW